MKIIHCLMFTSIIVIWYGLSAQAGPSGRALDGVLDATYTIENREVRLLDGRAEVEAAPGSAVKITTAVFGEPVLGDLDGDGLQDAALILTYDPGGSGTFYYVAAAIANNSHYRGTNAVLLGDRVAPRRIEIRNGMVIVHYVDRRPEEPMTTPLSIGKTMHLKLKAERLEANEAP